MLLVAVDIGNTNVVIGFLDDGHIAGTYRITTKANHTSDEYGLMIAIPAAERLCAGRCGRCDHHVGGAEGHAFVPCQHCEIPQYRSDDCWTGSQNRHQYSHGQSAEYGRGLHCRLCGSLLRVWRADSGGGFRHGHHIQLCDRRCVGDLRAHHHRHSHRRGRLVGCHGPVAGSGDHAPSSILAKSTRPAMQAGLYYNFLGGIERTIAQFHREIDEDFRVVATGGLSRVFADDTDMIDIYDPDLIFKGMLHIYERNVR